MKHIKKFETNFNKYNENNITLDIPEDDLNNIIHDGRIDEYGYKVIEINYKKHPFGFDSEKGDVEYDIIIQRISDEKFFKGNGNNYGRGDVEVDNQFYEVLPQQETITVYK